MTDHLIVWGQNDSNNLFKPTNQTGFSDLDTYYFNTGIALQNAVDLTTHRLSFPSKSGTLSTIKYKHNIVLSGAIGTSPGYYAYCTFSFINDSPATISNLSALDTALAANFSSKICPACGLFSYNGSSMTTGLVTGVIHNYNGVCIYYIPLASTTSAGVMTVNAISGASSGTCVTLCPPFIDGATTIADTVEEC